VVALVLAPGWRGLAWLVLGFALVTAPVATRNLAIDKGSETNRTFVHVTGTQVVTGSHEREGVSIDGREYFRLTTGRDLAPAARAGVNPASRTAHPAWVDVDRVVERLLARPER
jgi:hypothetical protein